MNIFITQDWKYYRRWVNLIPSYLLPGATQFISGRRRAGIVWFSIFFIIGGIYTWLVVSPQTSYSLDSRSSVNFAFFIVWLGMIVDACRKPMQRVGFRGWIVLMAVFIVIVIAPAFLIRQFVVHAFRASSGGMQPTIMGKQQDQDGNTIMGDRILAEKITDRSRSPLRGDVIVFRTGGLLSSSPDSYYVSRVAGLPGETIGISPPYLIVNGNRVMEPVIFREISNREKGFAGFSLARTLPEILNDSNSTITLGTDEYFVLGDNTTGSVDSRYYGPIKKSSIVGRAILIYAPADRKRWIE